VLNNRAITERFRSNYRVESLEDQRKEKEIGAGVRLFVSRKKKYSEQQCFPQFVSVSETIIARIISKAAPS